MPLEAVFHNVASSQKLLVVLRSLKQAAENDVATEKNWWHPLKDVVDSIFIFIPTSDFYLDAYTTAGLSNAANELLRDVSAWLKADTQSIVFIAQTFGGYIAKEAMIIANDHPIYRRIVDATLGIVFVGTAHNESDNMFSKAIRYSAATELDCAPGSKIMRAFTSAEYLKLLMGTCNTFSSLGLPRRNFSFFEAKETPYQSNLLSRKQQLIISATLATLKLGVQDMDEKYKNPISLELDHAQLSSYATLLAEHRSRFSDAVKSLFAKRWPSQIVSATQPLQDPIKDTTTALFRMNVTERPSAPSGPAARLPCHFLGKYQRNPAFTGRSGVLKCISDALTPVPRASPGHEDLQQKKMALIGMGGMGKTQVALAYALKSFEDFPVILWAHAETRAKLAQSFSDFDKALGLSKETASNQRESVERVNQWLANTDVNWLVILDNVDATKNENSLPDFWPTGVRGSVLVTARDEADLGQFLGGQVYVLEKLQSEDAVDLLLKLSNKKESDSNREHARTICSRIDGLPLAISSVAGMVVSNKIALDDFIEEYSNIDLIRKSRPLTGPEAIYSYSLATVWDAQFAHLDRDSRSFLDILAFLDADGIQERFIHEAFRGPTAKKLRSIPSKKLRRLRDNLCIKDLVYRNEDIKKIWMHRLIQGFCQSTMTTAARQEAFDRAFELVVIIWPVPPRHNRQIHEMWPTQQELVPHIESLAECYRQAQVLSDDEDEDPPSPSVPSLSAPHGFAELLYNGGWYFYERGNFKSASALLEAAQDFCLAQPDGNEAILADIYGAYGSRDSESNDVISCKANFQLQLDYLLLAIEKGQIQRPNVREALAYGGLANATMGLKKYKEAEPLYRKCLDIWADCPGDPVIYVPHLAVCLTLQGRPTEAEELLMHHISEREAKFGVRDLQTYRTGIMYYALGNTQIRQKRPEKAYQTHVYAMEMLEVTLGTHHHRYGDCCYKVGWHLMHQGNYDEAKEKLQRALKIYQKEEIYCNEAARTHHILGRLSEKMEDNAEARECHKRAEQLRRRILKVSSLPPGDEKDYDDLIMFWSV